MSMIFKNIVSKCNMDFTNDFFYDQIFFFFTFKFVLLYYFGIGLCGLFYFVFYMFIVMLEKKNLILS
jgi:hypothetical protein